jgi:hypothetical protein
VHAIITTLWALEEINIDDPISTINHKDMIISLNFCKWRGGEWINQKEMLKIEKKVLGGELC